MRMAEYNGCFTVLGQLIEANWYIALSAVPLINP